MCVGPYLVNLERRLRRVHDAASDVRQLANCVSCVTISQNEQYRRALLAYLKQTFTTSRSFLLASLAWIAR